MTGARDVALLVGAVGVAALVALVAVVSWRVLRQFRTLRARLRRALPAGVHIPGPEALPTAWVHLHRRLFDARVVTSTGTKRQALVLRRELWGHVDAANAALSQAQIAEAPVGDLPRLIGQLGNLARQQDRQLALLTHRGSNANLGMARAETSRIAGCADEITAAAFESLGCVPTCNSSHIAHLVEQEAQAVRAGSEHLRAVSSPHG